LQCALPFSRRAGNPPALAIFKTRFLKLFFKKLWTGLAVFYIVRVENKLP
jgi:hypothetical protein